MKQYTLSFVFTAGEDYEAVLLIESNKFPGLYNAIGSEIDPDSDLQLHEHVVADLKREIAFKIAADQPSIDLAYFAEIMHMADNEEDSYNIHCYRFIIPNHFSEIPYNADGRNLVWLHTDAINEYRDLLAPRVAALIEFAIEQPNGRAVFIGE